MAALFARWIVSGPPNPAWIKPAVRSSGAKREAAPKWRIALERRSGFARLLERSGSEADAVSRRQPQIPFGLPDTGALAPLASGKDGLGFAAAEYGQHQPPDPSGEVARQSHADPTPAETLPSIDPAGIAAELGLPLRDPAALLKARRDFAFGNHPDRVLPHLRERAARRMQIANALIDEALRPCGATKR